MKRTKTVDKELEDFIGLLERTFEEVEPYRTKTLSFRHSGSLGDVVYSLPAVLSMCQQAKARPVIYLQPDVKANYYAGCKHPAGDVRMNSAGISFLMPLLRACGFESEEWSDQKFELDLDHMRTAGIDYTRGDIPRWYFYCFRANWDLSMPWMTVEPMAGYEDKVVVNRTSRYRNTIAYNFLKRYEVVFLGLEDEYWAMKAEVPNAVYKPVEDALEAARIIAGARCYVGGQSFLYSVAEALKVRRVLETCPWAANVIPHGRTGWDAISQRGFELCVEDAFGGKE